MSKFQDDPTVNESKIVVLLEQIWVYAEEKKKIGFWERKKGQTIWTEERVFDLICLFIVRVPNLLFILFFLYFIIS